MSYTGIGTTKLQQQIYESVVRPAFANLAMPVTGIIESIDTVKMLANVHIQMPNSPNRKLLTNVPVQTGIRGFHQSGPFEGDRVIINFSDGSIHSPYIVGIIDIENEDSTREDQAQHPEQGPYVTDYICARTGWTITNPYWS